MAHRAMAFNVRDPPHGFWSHSNQFVADWPHVGIVTRQPGPPHDPTLPLEMHVETGSEFPEGGSSIRLTQAPPLHDPYTAADPQSHA